MAIRPAEFTGLLDVAAGFSRAKAPVAGSIQPSTRHIRSAHRILSWPLRDGEPQGLPDDVAAPGQSVEEGIAVRRVEGHDERGGVAARFEARQDGKPIHRKTVAGPNRGRIDESG
jgi:hypothetical protein